MAFFLLLLLLLFYLFSLFTKVIFHRSFEQQLLVRVPLGEFSSLRSNFVIDSYFSICSTAVLPKLHINNPGHSAKSASGRLQINMQHKTHVVLLGGGKKTKLFENALETASHSCRTTWECRELSQELRIAININTAEAKVKKKTAWQVPYTPSPTSQQKYSHTLPHSSKKKQAILILPHFSTTITKSGGGAGVVLKPSYTP